MMATPEEQTATMIANMPEKTGKSMEDWLALVAKNSAEKHGEIVKFLKSAHGMTHGFANLVAHIHRNPSTLAGPQAGDDPVVEQYSGAKADLKPIYDRIVAFIDSLGDDAELAPKKAYVSLRRSKQFGIIQPSTKTRVDLGINLMGVEPVGRLEASGSFNGMVSHRVRLEKPADFDDDVKGWLKDAYDGA